MCAELHFELCMTEQWALNSVKYIKLKKNMKRNSRKAHFYRSAFLLCLKENGRKSICSLIFTFIVKSLHIVGYWMGSQCVCSLICGPHTIYSLQLFIVCTENLWTGQNILTCTTAFNAINELYSVENTRPKNEEKKSKWELFHYNWSIEWI